MMRFFSSALISIPLLACFFFFALTYEVGEELKIGIPLFFLSVVIFCADYFLENKTLSDARLSVNPSNPSLWVIKVLSAFIVLMGAWDLIDHGLIILTPANYSTFQPHEAWIRHFSSLCWILAPVALILPSRRSARVFLFSWAFIFPILVMDRNRLLMAFTLTILSFFLIELPSSWRRYVKWLALGGVGLGVLFFVIVGQRRVGTLNVHSLYEQPSHPRNLSELCDVPKNLPVKAAIKNLPGSFQWIFLYTTTPIYNLSIQMKCGLQDSSLLKAQLIPLWKRYNQVGSPYLVSWVQNVGTEFMPFYLALGMFGLMLCFLLEYAILRSALELYLNQKNIFNLLILLRFSYCAIFTGFAPQFFTWTNLGFFLVIKLSEKLSQLNVFQKYFEPYALRWWWSR